MAMVNMNNLLNGKDSRWLQLEVCREFQRNKCTRPDTECKFAHPPANVEVQNGRVTACYDSIKGRCNREKPPCKYFHPPQHLKDQLLINGRNHLALKNALMQQMGLTPGQALVPGQVPTVATNPYLTGMPQVGNTYSPYFAPSPIMPAIMGPADPTGVGSPLGVVPQTVAMPQKMPRTDRLEVCREFQRGACKRGETECRFAHPLETVQANEDGSVTVCMDAVKGRCNRDPCRYFHPPLHLQAHIKATQSRASIAMDMKSVGSFYYENFAFPGMVPYKRPAGDKSGVPVYQPTGATTYQQLMQLQQPFVPVSCEYTGTPPLPAQSSNHQSVQNTIQNQGAAVNADTNGHGLLLDPNNPPPPPPAATSGDKNNSAANHDTDNTQTSPPELNHANSPQLNQLALPAPPPMSPMTSMSGLTSVPNVVSMNHMVSVNNMANVTSMANYTMANMANINVLNSLGMSPSLSLDPAALAKEVAQKNYAKALKLSQATQSYAINPLTALNYTGVALNKQALTVANHHAAAAAAAAIPGAAASRQVVSGLAGIGGAGLTSPLQAGILAYPPRAPTSATFNPYSLIRQQMLPTSPYMQTSLQGVPTAATVQSPYLQSHYAAMLPGVAGNPGYATAVQAMPQLSTASPATIAAQPQVALPANSGVIMQPYKKMKTT
ncbi:uncharacterized protein LOC127278033 isoform X3 [Leptopilina boulardi]|uniref:uncharacterized protein LOC127278033 isoform X3 n=1 Tax=Leptopilina boulardi TaxID=63433 RepID=UPI0021F613A6|nr:uncharacterized protein LOC127278033 isoform X3 [Leptopilina boulardi]